MRLSLILACTLFFTACKKEEETPAATPTKPADPAATKPAEPAAKPPEPAAADKPATPAADASADLVQVHANHNPKKEGDPVVINFKTFAVTAAKLTDVEKLDGSTATVEIDLGSLSSGIDKRDTHLKTADYLDVGVSPKATATVSDVKQERGDRYTAKVHVDAHGVKADFPVTFEVVEKKADAVRVKGEHQFKRSDFKIGKAEGAPNETAAENLTLKFALTIPKTK